MNTRHKKSLGLTMTLLLALGAVAAQGCGGDDDDDDTPVIIAGRGGSGGTSGGSSEGGGTGEGGDGTGNTGNGGTGNTGTGGTGGTGDTNGDCFTDPQTVEGDVEFLNRCTDSRCSPFDNARIPGFDGTLPEL